MTTIEAEVLLPDAGASTAATANLPISLGRHVSIFVMGFAAAFFASGTFALLTVGLFVPLAKMMGLPMWLTIAVAVPLVVLSIAVAVTMFVKTVRVERMLARNPGAI